MRPITNWLERKLAQPAATVARPRGRQKKPTSNGFNRTWRSRARPLVHDGRQSQTRQARHDALRNIHLGRAEEERELARHRLAEHGEYAGAPGSIVVSESGQ
jgi:hypothetical protein